MSTPLNLLIVEDSHLDFQLIKRHLQRHGLAARCHRVASREGLEEAIERGGWDVVLTDYNVPNLNFRDTLSLLQARRPNLPLILVSGSVGEEQAVELLKLGVWDFVLKDNLVRLAPAIERSLREAARPSVRESEEKYRGLFESSRDAIMTLEPPAWKFTSGNPATFKMFGAVNEGELVSYSPWDLSPERQPDGRLSAEKAVEIIEAAIREGARFFEWTHRRISGEEFPANVLLSRMQSAGKAFLQATVRDLTESKRAEAVKLFRTLIDQSNDAIEVLDPETGRFLDLSDKGRLELGYSREELLNLKISDIDPLVDPATYARNVEHIRKPGFLIFESLHRRKDGSTFPVEINAKYVRLDRDYIVAVVRDITERKRGEEALRESQRFLRSIAEASPHWIYVFDLEMSGITYSNHSILRELGYPWDVQGAVQTVGAFGEFITPGELPHLARVLEEWRVLCDGQFRDDEYRLCHADGSTRTFAGREVVLARRSDGTVWQILGTLTDITVQKRAEEALQQSERSYREIFNTANDAIFIHDADSGAVLDVNDSMLQLFGVSREEALQLKPDDSSLGASPYSAAEARRWMAKAIAEGPQMFEWRARRKNGELFWVEVALKSADIGGQRRVLAVARDITERKRAEAALTESERKYRELVEHANSIVLHWTRDGRVTFLNEFGQQFFGYPEAEILGRHVVGTIVPETESTGRDLRPLMDQICAAPLAFEHIVNENMRRNGEKVWIAWTNRADFDEQGRVAGVVSIGTNITELKRAEDALRTSEGLLSNAVEMARLGPWEYDVARDLFTFNDHFYRIFHTTAAQVGGYTMSSAEYARRFVHPDDMALVGVETRKAIETSDPHFSRSLEHRIIYADGTIGHITVRFSIVKDALGRTVKTYGVNQDITERKRAEEERERLEEQLRQSQKMEAVGQLAGGVAHDFNNLLQVILGYTESVRGHLEPDTDDREALEEVYTAAKRAAELTRQLLAFSRRQIIQPVNLDLNDLIQGVLKMIRRIIGEHIRLCFVPGESLGAIHVDKGQIEQILINLCVNARDAMPKGGTLTLETENVILDAAYCHEQPGATEGRHVLLSVTDTGHGMDEATRAQIFEPFFTTKGLGQGTGLGLAMVYGIVKQHNGFIRVQSEPGKGAAFRVYLPVVEQPLEEAGACIKERATGGSQTILVAEDEEMVQGLVIRILEAAGYTVLVASDGEEALRVFDKNADAIDMAILDVVMPGLGGREVMDRIQAKCPRMRFLFSSGYSESAIHTDFVIKEGLRLIAKPYSQDDLLRAVRETLEAPQSP